MLLNAEAKELPAGPFAAIPNARRMRSRDNINNIVQYEI